MKNLLSRSSCAELLHKKRCQRKTLASLLLLGNETAPLAVAL